VGSQVFLPAADSLSPVDLEAEIVRLRSDLQHGRSHTRLAMRSLQEVQALLLGLQGSAIAVGQLAQLIGHVQATCKMFEEARLKCVQPSSRPSAPLVRGHPPD
jgi:uncharacterized protein YigA (DUF484 family)